MKKLLKTLSQMYFAREVDTLMGNIKGIGRAYDILLSAYPDNPFVQGFVEGGKEVVRHYQNGYSIQRKNSEMDSIVDLFMIGYRGQESQTRCVFRNINLNIN